MTEESISRHPMFALAVYREERIPYGTQCTPFAFGHEFPDLSDEQTLELVRQMDQEFQERTARLTID